MTSWLIKRARALWRRYVPHRVPGYPGVRFRGAPPVVDRETGRRLTPRELAGLIADLLWKAHLDNGPSEQQVFHAAIEHVTIEWVPGRMEVPGFRDDYLGLWRPHWIRVAVDQVDWPAVLAHELRHEGRREISGDPDAEHRTWTVDVERVELWLSDRWRERRG